MGERIWMPQWLPPSGSGPGPAAGTGAVFSNSLAITKELGGDTRESPFMQRKPWPAALQLDVTIRHPALALDWWSIAFPVCVRALRAAWSGASDGVEYRPVDASRWCAEVRAMHYRLMHVMAEESVIDPAQSDYDTAPQLPWLPDGFPLYVRSLAVREDAAPKHGVFRDAFARNHMFCTDAMALSALKARCIGVCFIDPAAQHLLQPTRYRTLEGVAEICDAGILRGEGERLVQRIPIHQERR